MDEPYGIDRDRAHPRSRELVPDEFFWDCVSDLAPFGSDEGDTALAEYRAWCRDNPEAPLIDCLIWTVESVGEMDFTDYDDSILSPELVARQVSDPAFDDRQYLYTVDVSVIATGFGQLVDRGTIEADAKPVIALALQRQVLWARAFPEWEHADTYIRNLRVLERVLEKA